MRSMGKTKVGRVCTQAIHSKPRILLGAQLHAQSIVSCSLGLPLFFIWSQDRPRRARDGLMSHRDWHLTV